jgi:hypothetical protein
MRENTLLPLFLLRPSFQPKGGIEPLRHAGSQRAAPMCLQATGECSPAGKQTHKRPALAPGGSALGWGCGELPAEEEASETKGQGT